MHSASVSPSGPSPDPPAPAPPYDGGWLPWRQAAERALYGAGGPGPYQPGQQDPARPNPVRPDPEHPDSGRPGFYRREAPHAHFRTSVHASALFARAVAELLCRVDSALDRPRELALLDVGAGRGELLTGVLDALPDEVAARVRAHGVERTDRPSGLHPRIGWSAELPAPASTSGLLFANEWLDNVPLDVARAGPDGAPRTVLVRPADGAERLGDPLPTADAAWLRRWWPLDGTDAADGTDEAYGMNGPDADEPELRAEVGRTRDEAWAAAVRTVRRGLAVAVDYAHTRDRRPPFGTLTGYREGREVAPVPDGSCDLTAHVALDACAEAGGRGRAASPRSLSQRAALHALGVRGDRPPLSLASTDPAAYVRELSAAGEAAELTDPGGLGGFTWLAQPVGTLPPLLD